MLKRYARYFSDPALQEKLRRFAGRAGQKLVFGVLLLYYCMISPSVPLKKKASIAAALGYFIFPFDFLPDLLPLIGFADDLTVILFALTQISSSLTPEIRKQARKKMELWFRKADKEKMTALERRLPIWRGKID
jgi:uncharacterized membrane protein YkvA (DUF1232 family)